jgi:hypothetical protein
LRVPDAFFENDAELADEPELHPASKPAATRAIEAVASKR